MTMTNDRSASTHELREGFAAYAHAAWCEYMRYFLDRLDGQQDGALLISKGYNEALRMLIDTPYADLPEHQKDEDRKQADRMLAILAENWPELPS